VLWFSALGVEAEGNVHIDKGEKKRTV